ncbi:hypothetical protein BUPH_08374 (plasmid) [Paraburkholderia phenoliruptrix BR3459a]|uniref:Uncharacterized protein n=1 Tax=Paraburkholderia phenoliruptrix BR3459a TaxID=1229205 RepID=K0E1I9_9BURK|nr:hypothetical protein BUPH_08374 [Paraburkholderia phenoliruptrix BR3459a]
MLQSRLPDRVSRAGDLPSWQGSAKPCLTSRSGFFSTDPEIRFLISVVAPDARDHLKIRAGSYAIRRHFRLGVVQEVAV